MFYDRIDKEYIRYKIMITHSYYLTSLRSQSFPAFQSIITIKPTCPYCRHQINIKKNTIQIGSGLEAQDQLVPSTKGRNSTPQWIVR
jgi:hypothetical protein